MMPGAHTPTCPVTDCDKHIGTLHVYVKEELWKLFIKLFNGKVSETERAIILRRFPRSSKCAKGMCEVKFRLHSRPGNWWLNRQRQWIWPLLSSYS